MKFQGSDKLLIGSVYRSPNSKEWENEVMMIELIRATQRQYSHILITGDFNYPTIDWEAFSTPHDSDNTE